MRSDPFRIIKEKQRDLLDLLDGRLFPEFGVLDIETHEIRDIVYIAVIDNTEFEEKNILVNNDIRDGKANAGIILMQFVQGWETCIHLLRRLSRCTLLSSLLSSRAMRFSSVLAVGSTTYERWDGFSANFKSKV